MYNRHIMLRRLLNWLLIITAAIIIAPYIYAPHRHARPYNYISKENIFKQLKLNKPNITSSPNSYCVYENIILKNENTNAEISTITANKPFQQPLLGGEFKPRECLALLKTALIIPYRNRPQQLNIFLNFMHHFLQKQNIHYRIFIVDQNDTLPFNRAKLFNYGAKLAISLNYNCLILHDVDLIPLNSGNIYGCAKVPRHMSCNVDTFRYNLPYPTIFGGAISILSEQYEKVNGMSNTFYGWGGEDDDFYRRVVRNGFKPCRFSPEVSRYIMLRHKKQKTNENRFKLLKLSAQKSKTDGLNSLSDQYSIILEELYTCIIIS